MNKRYLLFAYDEYYPGGGMYDCKLRTNDWDEINREVVKLAERYDYVQYYDSEVDDFFDWDSEYKEWVMKNEHPNC